MRRSLLPISLISALALTACGLLPAATTTDGSVQTPSSTTPGIDLNMDDPELLQRLGSPPFEDVTWTRTIDGIPVLGATGSADQSELELVAAALEEVPAALLTEGQPRNLIRVQSGGGEEAIGKAVAFTKGPDIYLVDRTFAPNDEDTTRLELTRALIHEIAHVAQYRALEATYIQAALAGEVEKVDPAAGSALVQSFAASVGWIDQNPNPFETSWFLPTSIEASTDYGRTGAGEDMAEAVSMVVLGRSNWIPATHTRWVEQWLGKSSASLANGKPWAPAGSREVLSKDPLYDETSVTSGAFRFEHIEPAYFSLPADTIPHAGLAAEIQVRLLERRISGVLALTDDDRLPHYAGMFTRTDGVSLWVELWDFREATGFKTADPILTYVVLW